MVRSGQVVAALTTHHEEGDDTVSNWKRGAVIAAAIAATLALVATPVAAAEGAIQIDGTGGIHAISDGENPAFTKECPEPVGYAEFGDITLELTEGNLRGCWYTLVEAFKFSPSIDAAPVVYQERGREVFVGGWYDDDGNLLGEGTFETTYKFTAKFADASLAVEIHGRCQHPIVAGTGTGVFEGATGRVDFKDDVATGVLHYRGHISVP